MGTRNMTLVIDESGTKKIAQYGQWDGYPSGVGVGILEFLGNGELLEKLKSNMSKLRFLDYEGVDKEFIDDYNSKCPNWSNEPDKRSQDQKDWWSNFCHRDLAEKVLTNIANYKGDEILLINSENRAIGSESCIEYSYIIDFQNRKFTIKHQLDDVNALGEYFLDHLPSEEDFIKALEEEE
ncbi:hypothetical protein [Sphingobacterium yanglingense]|uniref:Uncharacterized protein n=1 Tax=Sphingobacterium yanglingense TaxID=1437280 RepID=A0A4R6WLD1_9SPHI|nr:hypothetical protein [Sphingobacterium yanglingense]TDQ79542.1 hypothetical protein CLV99_0985 [Sphingobacterium yanglingense]